MHSTYSPSQAGGGAEGRENAMVRDQQLASARGIMAKISLGLNDDNASEIVNSYRDGPDYLFDTLPTFV